MGPNILCRRGFCLKKPSCLKTRAFASKVDWRGSSGLDDSAVGSSVPLDPDSDDATIPVSQVSILHRVERPVGITKPQKWLVDR